MASFIFISLLSPVCNVPTQYMCCEAENHGQCSNIYQWHILSLGHMGAIIYSPDRFSKTNGRSDIYDEIVHGKCTPFVKVITHSCNPLTFDVCCRYKSCGSLRSIVVFLRSLQNWVEVWRNKAEVIFLVKLLGLIALNLGRKCLQGLYRPRSWEIMYLVVSVRPSVRLCVLSWQKAIRVITSPLCFSVSLYSVGAYRYLPRLRSISF